uniref:protein-glutamine gamma-glutamyltransferase n=1 Tax=Amazona collaria TaxID=241587 RepID=A0A8B9FSW0_9PSIT
MILALIKVIWKNLHLFFCFIDLTPTHISWQPSVNASTHHTDRYANTELTVRRGQAFTITLYFNRPKQNGESLAFVTEIGPSPSESHHTKAVFNLSEVGASGWSAAQGPSEAGYVNFTISSPANAVIGRYNLILQVTSGNKIFSRFLGQFVLLFNPWCPGDDVYMDNENERQEYVLNENGIIFVGNAKYIEARGWYYGQFQDHLLNICLTMLDLSLYYRQDPAIDVSRRGDPKYVGRVISSMINGNDNDNGVLLGKWQGSFHSDENPSRWDGSVVILQKWRQDNYKPVRYGQCWVFAGVMCTVLRCLGIPTRLVSNFNSAHDVDRNLSIDKYYDSSGKSLNIGKDSTWDYHVWNESWFIRPDLGTSYNGWQVLDATPQEQSKGLFQCGPASVIAIKEGDVDLDYDTLFVYTEVNADCNRWIVYNDGTKKRVYCDTEIIGRFISTKAVGSNSRVDVTYSYKYPEGKRVITTVIPESLKAESIVYHELQVCSMGSYRIINTSLLPYLAEEAGQQPSHQSKTLNSSPRHPPPNRPHAQSFSANNCFLDVSIPIPHVSFRRPHYIRLPREVTNLHL